MPTETVAVIIALITLIVQIGLGYVGLMIKSSLTATSIEIVLLKEKMSTLADKMTGIDILRNNMHNLRDEVHSLKLRLALKGIYTPGDPGESFTVGDHGKL
jgi:hypothetical protein